jgi:hypothetical protein|tara:strand:- start:255 stop:530 length:276 start_codon:yes stop_codon:yes gene_type:complete
VEPGDTVWWHADVVHAVEHKHQGSGVSSSVLYIGSAPWCDRNLHYLERQKPPFPDWRRSKLTALLKLEKHEGGDEIKVPNRAFGHGQNWPS